MFFVIQSRNNYFIPGVIELFLFFFSILFENLLPSVVFNARMIFSFSNFHIRIIISGVFMGRKSKQARACQAYHNGHASVKEKKIRYRWSIFFFCFSFILFRAL